MKKYLSLFAFLFSISLFGQNPQDVYRKPLKEVLADIEKRYSVKFQYSENLVRNIDVMYPSWRYRMDTEETLNNILLPLDLVYARTGENSYQISKFDYYRKSPEEGQRHLDKLLSSYKTAAEWEARKAELRKCFLEQLNLSPLPKRTPLNPVFTPVRKFDGYTVQNVAIETVPGVWLSGSLYRPAKGKGPFPAILCTHGHPNSENPAEDDLYKTEQMRYRPQQQYRCASLARMGAVVFSYEMFAYGESLLQVSIADHRSTVTPTIQTWNSIRVVDFLTSLPYVDAAKIGVTGESGGGTQTFILAALDDRIAVSAPVVMVSSYFAGGCTCESGLPIHSCTELMTNNAEIAAMVSPKPLLVVSDGNDWTADVPRIEFPYLKKVYALYGKEGNVENVHFPDETHNYGASKRAAMYDFMAKHLGLDLTAVKDKKTGRFDESKVTIEPVEALLVFGKEKKLPAGAVMGIDAVREAIKSVQ
ncbi:MAG TPA: acetylxylan esterase [Bacteroidales bacterium]|nr:acetylxylan esterase [Bacteroidales bacterium]